MLDLTKDIQSLTSFRRQSGDFLKQVKKSKRPGMLTVNGESGGDRTGSGSLSATSRKGAHNPSWRETETQAI